MTTLFRGIRLVSLVSLALVTGCGLFGKKEGAADAEAEAAVAEVAEAAPPPVATPAAANENDVSRFPDEKKVENVTATIARPTNVREIPGIGKIVASLNKGGTVTEIAQRGTFFLVVFTNPADQKSLMGWISQDSFTAAVAPIIAIKCTVPETALISDSAFCGKICTQDIDCVSGQACRGTANKLLATGAKGDAVRVCTVFGTPRVVAVADAAPPPAAPPPPPVAPAAPICPAGQILLKDNACHQANCKIGTCTNAATPQCVPCKGTTACVGPGGRALCQ
jgi:hypothetical protein